ncbi:50S ribosomal protein L25 [Candidatus Karelsulcia muelleri]
MKLIVLKAEKRFIVTKKQLKSFRESGYLPGTVYGKNKNINFFLDYYFIEKILKNQTINKFLISINNEINITTILKEIQYHPISEKILHLDFCELNKKKYITYEVPIKHKGLPRGVTKGGEYIYKLRRLKIKAFPKDMVDHIEINIENLDIGDKFYVKNLNTKQIVILHDSKSVISSVKALKKECNEKEKTENTNDIFKKDAKATTK